MITKNNIPKSYKPFNVLKICSNIMIGGGTILLIGDIIPLLVGQGDKPMIWLQAVSNTETNQFITIVEASISKYPAIKVIEDEGSIIVGIHDTMILRVKVTDEATAIIDKLDLRPLGMNIYGDDTKLQAGGLSFINSTFHGVGTLIAFGPPSNPQEAEGA